MLATPWGVVRCAIMGAILLLIAPSCGSGAGAPPAGPAQSISEAPDASRAASGDQPGLQGSILQVPPQSVAATAADRRMYIPLNSNRVYIRNGGRIDLGDGYAVEIYVDPFPPRTLKGSMDFYLTRDGQPVIDAGMEIAYDMLAMAHGPFSDESENIGGGHYLFNLNYIMFGPWDQTITVRIELRRIKVPLVLVAYP